MSEKKVENTWKYIGIMGVGAVAFNQLQGSPNLWVSLILIAFTIGSFTIYFKNE
ncbi:hypothetical protein [Daejeonella sp.]|uniref:hypothetical protein n=1 Tax=Daejeonella sp. TaxID=2805397 RepID=UPI002731EA71|nr:hypothetical protein [Daejeonella sp.]MDP2413839.1 hypothetical protein [Daejeonella sp.]